HITIANDDIQVQTSPLLTNQFGTLSKAVFVAIIEETVRYEMRKLKKLEVMIESLNIIYIKTVQIESEINVHYDKLDVCINFVKLDVTMTSDCKHVEKEMIMCQNID